MFENIGFTELLMILVLVLVLFGARRVPEIGASIGKGIREFKRSINGLDDGEPGARPLRRDPLPFGTERTAGAAAREGWDGPAEPPREPKRLM